MARGFQSVSLAPGTRATAHPGRAGSFSGHLYRGHCHGSRDFSRGSLDPVALATTADFLPIRTARRRFRCPDALLTDELGTNRDGTYRIRQCEPHVSGAATWPHNPQGVPLPPDVPPLRKSHYRSPRFAGSLPTIS